MKKLAVLALVVVFMLSFTATAMALSQTIEGQIGGSEPDVVYVAAPGPGIIINDTDMADSELYRYLRRDFVVIAWWEEGAITIH